jgi:hypothetical protein
MTDGDPWTRFVGQLPHWLALQVHRTDSAMDSLLLAMANGWPIDRLAGECSRDLTDTTQPGGVVLTRLRQASRERPGPEPDLRQQQKRGRWRQPLPWCGVCDDPRTRWLVRPDGGVQRCPVCWTDPR